MANLISSKVFEYFIVSLIIFYTLIVFVNFGLSDSSNDNNEEIAETIYVLAICELVVLVIFTMEIIANIYVYNFKVINDISSQVNNSYLFSIIFGISS